MLSLSLHKKQFQTHIASGSKVINIPYNLDLQRLMVKLHKSLGPPSLRNRLLRNFYPKRHNSVP